ncbi:hypothetical protein [Sphingomonas sp. CARO-RG-8B-R24-01]|uniref:hypothetical protein n=1 Tax=Sphingomonas sp. CARO-RG-8B-R24-01 TaxID=2914831 RepID=UPI001F55F6BA|nr:hypothetical protein [Sphingomonas sp. CARO-RG-8B-R24-01]
MMLGCLLLGDSIADGTALALRAIAGDRCAIVAKRGAATDWIASANPKGQYDTVVLSSGSNDAEVPGLEERLIGLRAGIVARQVVWLLPYNRRAAELVRRVAVTHCDRWVDLIGVPTTDGVHPRSYLPVALAAEWFISGTAKSDPASATEARSSPPPNWVISQGPSSVLVFK